MGGYRRRRSIAPHRNSCRPSLKYGAPLRARWLEFLDPVHHGDAHGIRSVPGAHLLERAVQMELYRHLGDREPGGDLAIGGAAGEELDAVELARREVAEGGAQLERPFLG